MNNSIIENKETLCCSSNSKQDNGIIIDSQCWHKEMVFANDELTKQCRSVLKKGYHHTEVKEGTNSWFGPWIILNAKGVVKLGEEKKYNVICTKMDQQDVKSMPNRANIFRRWSVENVFDVEDCHVCMLRAKCNGSGLYRTKMKCTMCKLGSQRMYRNESGFATVIMEVGTVTFTENS